MRWIRVGLEIRAKPVPRRSLQRPRQLKTNFEIVTFCFQM